MLHRFTHLHPGEIRLPRHVLGKARRRRGRHAGRGLVGAAVPRGGAVRAQAPARRSSWWRGEDAAVAFARSVAAYLGDERVHALPERADYPSSRSRAILRTVARRMEAVHALARAAARSWWWRAPARSLRALPPAGPNVHVPLCFGRPASWRTCRARRRRASPEFGDLARCSGGARLRRTPASWTARHLRRARRHRWMCSPATWSIRCGSTSSATSWTRSAASCPPPGRPSLALPDVEIYPVVGVLHAPSGVSPARVRSLDGPAEHEPRAARRAGEAGRRPALRRLRRAACPTCTKSRVHAGRLRAVTALCAVLVEPRSLVR